MQYCPMTCATRLYVAKSRAEARPRVSAPTAYRLLEGIAKGLRWQGLEELLCAIPDSNDDFGIF